MHTEMNVLLITLTFPCFGLRCRILGLLPAARIELTMNKIFFSAVVGA